MRVELSSFVIALVSVGVVLGTFVYVFSRFYRKVEQGKALIINKMRKDPEVTFTGGAVWPVFHKAELMDISVKTIEIDRRGKEGLICEDNIRADIKVTFYVRVNKTAEDVIKVAQAVGCARASDHRTLEELFNAKFSEALKTVGKQLPFEALYTKREEFRDQIIQLIGRDLNGYVLEDAAIDFLEQTPLEHLDPKNILDAQGIRKITELTAEQHVRTNHYTNEEKKRIKKQDVDAREAILEPERQQADAEAKQSREVEGMRAREQAETLKIQQEERLKSESARIKTEEEVAIAEQNRQREVEVAQKNRERVVAVEEERVQKARHLEAIDRERETALRTIEKEKAVEVEKRDIANVIRERIVVEKTVAEQEEAIKTLRVVEDANRTREATVISAEAEAQEALVKDIKAAEAAEAAARFKAKEEITLAEARFEAAEREAKARVRLAEARRAEVAAEGLATVQVKEADAIATEKMGKAEAFAMQEKLVAEAHGLKEKADALNSFDEATRAHEEYRLVHERELKLGVEGIAARIQVARAQAELVKDGLAHANIDIVGGDSIFFDRLVNAIGMGESLDRFVGKSEVARALVDGVAGNGSPGLGDRLKRALGRGAAAAGAAETDVEQQLARLLEATADTELRTKLGEALERVRRLGDGG